MTFYSVDLDPHAGGDASNLHNAFKPIPERPDPDVEIAKIQQSIGERSTSVTIPSVDGGTVLVTESAPQPSEVRSLDFYKKCKSMGYYGVAWNYGPGMHTVDDFFAWAQQRAIKRGQAERARDTELAGS